MNQTSSPTDSPQLAYFENGRSGTIRYLSPETTFDMWYEFAASPAIAIINIPSPEDWEAKTNTPLARRADIVRFIGERVLRDKVSSYGYFEADDHFLTLFPE